MSDAQTSSQCIPTPRFLHPRPQALIHPSFGEWNMARLTWIGDAVLGAWCRSCASCAAVAQRHLATALHLTAPTAGMMVSDQLFRCLPPDSTTEALHDRRKALVRREACAKAAAGLGLDEAMVVGRGYEGKQPTMHMLAGKARRKAGRRGRVAETKPAPCLPSTLPPRRGLGGALGGSLCRQRQLQHHLRRLLGAVPNGRRPGLTGDRQPSRNRPAVWVLAAGGAATAATQPCRPVAVRQAERKLCFPLPNKSRLASVQCSCVASHSSV